MKIASLLALALMILAGPHHAAADGRFPGHIPADLGPVIVVDAPPGAPPGFERVRVLPGLAWAAADVCAMRLVD